MSADFGVDLLCAGAWVLTQFVVCVVAVGWFIDANSMGFKGILCVRGSRRRSFVRRRMGFNTNCCFVLPFAGMLMQIAWVLRFPRLSASIFCAQAHGF